MYEFRVRGRPDAHWATWFAGLTLTYEGDDTMLRGPLAHEAALRGVLTKVGNLNLHLLSVNAVVTGGTASTTPDLSTAIGHEVAPVDAAPGDPVEGMPVRKKKARSPRKRAPR